MLDGLASVGVEVEPGCELVREFPWSRVLRLTSRTDGRSVWAKRCGDGMAFEPELLRVVLQAGSPLLVETIWIGERWIATEHAGEQVRRGGVGMLETMRALQAPLAALQRRLATDIDAVRAAGTPTLQAGDVEPLVERALELCAERRHLGERPVTAGDARALRTATSRLRAQFELLETAAPPTTVQHLDLHHGNVFTGADEAPRLFDWGDARIGSPLLHVVSTASLLAHVTGVDPRDPGIGAVVGTYVAAWPDVVLTDELHSLVHDPRLAAFVRMDALVAALGTATDETLAPFEDWLPDVVRAAGATDPMDAADLRLAVMPTHVVDGCEV